MVRKVEHVVDMRDVGSPVFATLYAILHIPVPVVHVKISRWWPGLTIRRYYIPAGTVIIFLINIGTS